MTTHAGTEVVAQLIQTAERYPFTRPAQSYVYRGAPSARLEPDWRAGRAAVLAIGSNAAPERLRLKFPGDDQVIPVERAHVHGFAVVYAAHFARYGAIPATLYPEPGGISEVFVTWLTPAQLQTMHASEGVGQRYAYRTLEALRLEVDGGPEILAASAYVSRFGALSSDGRPVRLAAIAATSGYRALDQRGVLDLARERLAADLDHQAFMTRIVACFGFRTRKTRELARDALPWPEQPDRRSRHSPRATPSPPRSTDGPKARFDGGSGRTCG